MTAERDVRRCRQHASRRLLDTGYVAPAFWIARVGVDVKPSALFTCKRQFFKKPPLGLPKLAARPFHRDLRLKVEVLAQIGDCIVVVAADGDTAAVDAIHDRRDHPFGIGAIAHIVTEENLLLCTMLPRLLQACFEGLSIGVDVGKERDQH